MARLFDLSDLEFTMESRRLDVMHMREVIIKSVRKFLFHTPSFHDYLLEFPFVQPPLLVVFCVSI